jgi:hypothetical protein
METKYLDGKLVVSQCSWCEKDGKTTYTEEGKPITDYFKIWEIEDKLEKDIAVISNGICKDCLKALYPSMCKDDDLHLLHNNKNK